MYDDINYSLKFMIRYHEGRKEWKLSKRACTERECYSYIGTWGVYVLVSIQKGKLSYSIGRGLGDRTIIYS